MITTTRILCLSLCTASLSACMIDGTNNTTDYYRSDAPQSTMLYPEGYENTAYTQPTTPDDTTHQVIVPDSYHVGAAHSPTSPKDMDRQWVEGQSPQAYTIELADGDKASRVAGVLYKAPKNQHTAEVKYLRGGKSYYKGLYGTYPSYEEANQALAALPSDIKQGAEVKNWRTVQSGLMQ